MQRAARQAIDVLFVFLDEHAELGEIQVGVQGQQRIVCPFDEVDAEPQRPFSLNELQLPAEPRAAVRRQHAQHVGPVGQRSPVDGGNRIDESDHCLSVERTDQNGAAVCRHRQHRDGHDIVAVRILPDAFFELDDALEVVDRREIPDLHRSRPSLHYDPRRTGQGTGVRPWPLGLGVERWAWSHLPSAPLRPHLPSAPFVRTFRPHLRFSPNDPAHPLV